MSVAPLPSSTNLTTVPTDCSGLDKDTLGFVRSFQVPESNVQIVSVAYAYVMGEKR